MGLNVQVAPAWRTCFGGARVGMLAIDAVTNPRSHAELERRVAEIETALREKHRDQHRADLTALPTVQAYQRHYRAFGQTYHVVRQLESVALKSKPLASPSALVLAMFAAELESLVLTAAHDLDSVEPPVVVDASRAGDRFVGIGGQEHTMRADDMCIRDASGIVSAVVYGPDRRTRLSEATTRVLFTSYVPAEIDDAIPRRHLERIAELVRLVSPEAQVGSVELYG